MLKHRNDIRESVSCIDQNPYMFERQDPDNFSFFVAWELCALKLAAYVFKQI